MGMRRTREKILGGGVEAIVSPLFQIPVFPLINLFIHMTGISSPNHICLNRSLRSVQKQPHLLLFHDYSWCYDLITLSFSGLCVTSNTLPIQMIFYSTVNSVFFFNDMQQKILVPRVGRIIWSFFKYWVKYLKVSLLNLHKNIQVILNDFIIYLFCLFYFIYC